MDQKYKILTNLTDKEAAQIALDHLLFVRGWTLRHQLEDAAWGGPCKVILACDKDQSPIAVALVDMGWSTPRISVFVKDDHRRKGIGSMLVKEMKEEFPSLHFLNGIQGSWEFYKKNGLKHGTFN